MSLEILTRQAQVNTNSPNLTASDIASDILTSLATRKF